MLRLPRQLATMHGTCRNQGWTGEPAGGGAGSVLTLSPDALSGMDSSTTGMARCRCMRRWNVKTGKVHGMTAPLHTSQHFIAFLEGLVQRTLAKEIHVVLDNLAAHKTKDVDKFLQAHPRVRFHFTPTYS